MNNRKDVNQVQQFFAEVEEELVSLQSIDSFEMLREIIGYSKHLPEFPQDLMTEENRVHGCQSTVFISAQPEGEHVSFLAFSDAQVLRGYLGILLQGLNGLPAREFLQHAKGIVEGFAKRTNIAASVTPTRANAFGNIFELMEKQVRELA
ncbi:SufE family protein [Spirochaeta africana]|uniref:SufE protein probably involved in Fe-S center assembly n=1 Tax=Spirochaeta africana (strain ATCC 700263 / DSM 8902 / Z-7692) TaxID=889378 RepID=H9UIL2_SPIAZ|nr:SufE family protein [Spirochaeta africana]AFG37355.1 SufE protein probably involved in Fe-S center assembly [Spirochaeta africana DSM 8902]